MREGFVRRVRCHGGVYHVVTSLSMGIFTARSGLKWLGLRAGDFVWDSNGGARIARHRQGSCKWVEIVVVVETGVGTHLKTHPLKPRLVREAFGTDIVRAWGAACCAPTLLVEIG